MMSFVLVGAAMVIIALLCVVPSLLRKPRAATSVSSAAVNRRLLLDQLRELDSDLQSGTLDLASHASAKAELEQRHAAAQPESNPVANVARLSWLALLLAFAVPLTALGLYRLLGTPDALDPKQLVPQSQEVSQDQILGMVQRLADKLKQQPGDAQGWNMLARSYFELHRFQESADAYAHLTQLVPDNADYLASYGLTMALARNKNLQGEPELLLQRALDLDHKNIRALSLLGSAAFDRHDYPMAIDYWKRVLALVPSDSPIARSTSASVGEAEALIKDGTPIPVVRIPGKGS